MHLLPTLKTGKAGGTSSRLRGYLQAIYIPPCPHLMHYVPLGLQLPGTGNPCSMLARTWSKIALLPLKGQRGGCWGVCGHCLLVSFVVNSKKGILSSKFFLIYMHSVCLHVCTRLLCSVSWLLGCWKWYPLSSFLCNPWLKQHFCVYLLRFINRPAGPRSTARIPKFGKSSSCTSSNVVWPTFSATKSNVRRPPKASLDAMPSWASWKSTVEVSIWKNWTDVIIFEINVLLIQQMCHHSCYV